MFGLDGQTIGPGADVLAQRQKDEQAAIAKLAAQRQQTAQEAATAREQTEATERARVTAELRTLAWSQWSAAGGSEAEFKESWPRLRLRMLEDRAIAAEAAEQDDYARRLHQAGGRM